MNYPLVKRITAFLFGILIFGSSFARADDTKTDNVPANDTKSDSVPKKDALFNLSLDQLIHIQVTSDSKQGENSDKTSTPSDPQTK